jgi:hypothetical protein
LAIRDAEGLLRQDDLTVTRFDASYFDNRDREAFERAERSDLTARSALLRIAHRDPDPVRRQRAERALARLEPVKG